MKLLILGDIGTLERLEEQAVFSKQQIMHCNALLYPKSHEFSVTTSDGMCFGKYYGEIPPHDSRWVGKADLFDVVVEVGSDRMQSLCADSLYIRMDNAPTLAGLLKKVENERTQRRGSDTSEEMGKDNQDHGQSDPSEGL